MLLRLPVLRAAGAQAGAWVLLSLLAPGIWAFPVLLSIAQGLVAATLGQALGLAAWWLALNAIFPLLIFTAIAAGLPAEAYLGAFAILLAIFWTTFRTQVPLYLSHRRAVDALAQILPKDRSFHFLDLGCGTGTVLAMLAHRFPSARLEGVEIAPLPWMVAWWRLGRGGLAQVRCADLWQQPLGDYDAVYAFLSPVPMARLWEKVRREMRPGALFVSNTFEVPGVLPERSIPVGPGDRALHVWHVPESRS